MAAYSVRREAAKQFLSSDRFDLEFEHWRGFSVQGPFLVSPHGFGIHRNVAMNLEAFLVIQRLVGFYSDWVPAPAQAYDISYDDPRIDSMIQKLGAMLDRQGGN